MLASSIDTYNPSSRQPISMLNPSKMLHPAFLRETISRIKKGVPKEVRL
jgi:hypothetical protein